MDEKKRFQWETRGKALPENEVYGDGWRFTVLTPRLIRMEFSAEGQFEDRASQMVFYRDLPACQYTVTREDGLLTIDTAYLTLFCREGIAPSAQSLRIRLKDMDALWEYGQEPAGQLKGTVRTLDRADGPVPLEDGLCSRSGWTLLDDSQGMVLTEEGWFDVRSGQGKDLYFFGYGLDYVACIQDFYRLTGVPPLLPDYALGNWWSRYHAYTQQEYCALMERFEREDLPFSVAVVDMDWHIVDIPEECRNTGKKFDTGWTGYTWNRELFPDYREFLRFLQDHKLKTALNLHPAQGIGCHEVQYEQMARACGVDPDSKKRVKLDILDPGFMEKYFDILHHPYEAEGVNFWWMDWQQGTDYWWIHDEDHPESPLEKMDPLWLLNHLHILDISRNGKRPMFFSRYAGLGSHRYPVGFSGDASVTWETLNFQPYFTATASNVGYCWWSHDIGGHNRGYKDDELTVRWMQFGVFSPINRLHSTNSPFGGKEPWNLRPEAEQVAGDWLRLRHALFPYLYTMNYRTHFQMLPLVQPMYYLYPREEAAYAAKNQYWFGSELMVCPITAKNDPVSLTGETKIWFPEGMWIDFFNGLVYPGGGTRSVHRTLAQMPVFAKAGAIVPMETGKTGNALGRQENMTLLVFPGADNSFTMVEDLGDGDCAGHQARTCCDLAWGDTARLTLAAEGDLDILPETRNWTILFRGFGEGLGAEVTVGGRPVEPETSYDRATATLAVKVTAPVCEEIGITVSGTQGLVSRNAQVKDMLFDLLLHAQMSYKLKEQLYRNLETVEQLEQVPTEETFGTLKSALAELISLAGESR